MKRIIILITVVLLFTVGCSLKDNSHNKIIVTTSFPCYDFVRAIVKNSDIEVKLLLKPGMDMHEFEPTPKDVINIEKSLLFIYVGGESDEWVNDILSSTDKKFNQTFKLIDSVKLLKEELKDGMQGQEDDEIDEHVWTSPNNAIKIIESLRDKIIEIDPSNKDLYIKNANNYINEIKEVDQEIKNIISSSNKKELIFADRFSIRYFVEDYGLNYYAAFPGCAHETEANAKTISFLIDKVKKDDIKVVFKVELSDGNIAKTISEETGAKIETFQTCHNVSESDYESGVTYVDLMKRNIIVLKEALK